MIDLFSSYLYPLCTHTPHLRLPYRLPNLLISRYFILCLITNWAVTALRASKPNFTFAFDLIFWGPQVIW